MKSVAGRRPADFERGDDLGLAVVCRPDVVDREWLGHEVVDGLLRVEGLVRVLEDDLDPSPVVAQGPRAPRPAHVGALEPDRAGGLAGELDHDAPGRRLAAPRLADQRQNLATAQCQVDAIDGAHDEPDTADDGVDDPTPDREMDLETLQLEQRLAWRRLRRHLVRFHSLVHQPTPVAVGPIASAGATVTGRPASPSW